MATGSSEVDEEVLDVTFWAKEPETVDLWCTALPCAWLSSDAATVFLRDLGVAFSTGSAVFPEDSTRRELLVRLSRPGGSESTRQKKLKKSKKRKEAEVPTRGRDDHSSDDAGRRADGTKVHKRSSDADKKSRKEKKRRKHDKNEE